MVNLQLFGIVEREIVSTALFEYRQNMLKSGNSVCANKVYDILNRLDICDSDCRDGCTSCDLLLNLKECGYETAHKD